jgi:hypothetical protein
MSLFEPIKTCSKLKVEHVELPYNNILCQEAEMRG